MRRDPSLIRLSREHHGALILARLLQSGAPAYRNLPVDPPGKAQYALSYYHDHIQPHFANEERVYAIIGGLSPDLDNLLTEVLEEHSQLKGLFRSIPVAVDLPSKLDILGKALESHIRKEERVLFPLIEESCNEEQLALISEYLSGTA